MPLQSPPHANLCFCSRFTGLRTSASPRPAPSRPRAQPLNVDSLPSLPLRGASTSASTSRLRSPETTFAPRPQLAPRENKHGSGVALAETDSDGPPTRTPARHHKRGQGSEAGFPLCRGSLRAASKEAPLHPWWSWRRRPFCRCRQPRYTCLDGCLRHRFEVQQGCCPAQRPQRGDAVASASREEHPYPGSCKRGRRRRVLGLCRRHGCLRQAG